MRIKKIIFSMLFSIAFCTLGTSQEDSLSIWAKEIRRPGLTVSQKKVIGQKIMAFQQKRYRAAIEKQDKDAVANYLWIDTLALLPPLFNEVNDSIFVALASVAQDIDTRKDVRLNALRKIASLNTPEANLFLLDKMSDIMHLENATGADGELNANYPCFALIISKAPNNWGLITPIFETLHKEKTEDELLLLSYLLEEISDGTTALRIVDFHLEKESGNELFSNNLNQIKQLIQQK
jgi:hypothetical protein